MSQNHPARFFRATALGVVAAGLVVPAAASAQTPVSSAPLYNPTFEKTTPVDSGSGPVTFVLRGRFDGGSERIVAAVSDAGLSSSGDTVPAAVTLFGQVDEAYARTAATTLAGQQPVAAVAADLYGSGASAAVVASRGGTSGRLEAVDFDHGVHRRALALDGQPVAVAVGEFLPGQGQVVAVSLDGDRLAFYRPFEDGFELVQEFDGVPTGPLSSGPLYGGTGDALIATAEDRVHGVRLEYAQSGTPGTPFAATEVGTTTQAFATSNGHVAADDDPWSNRWYVTHVNGVSSLATFTTATRPSLAGYGPLVSTEAEFGAPVQLDLYGHDQRDAIVALDGATVHAYDLGSDTTTQAPLKSGRTAAALDVDSDLREELVVAEGTDVVLYRNRTGTEETKPELSPDALTPSLFDGAHGVQVVTKRAFDVTVPTAAGDEYQCAIGDGDWRACAGSPAPAFSVPADGPYELHVRRKVQGATFWSATQTIAFRVATGVPAKPVLPSFPAPNTNWPFFELAPVDGTRVEYRVDDGSDWLTAQEPWLNVTGLQDGPHRVTFRAVDELRDVASDTLDVDFVLDTVQPDAPAKLAGPDATTTKRTAVLGFEGEPDATFECLVDTEELKGAGVATRTASPWKPCANPLTLADLELGEHTVSVRQTDKAGNRSPRATWTWTIVAPDPEPVVDVPAPTEPQAPASETTPTPAPATTPAPAATPAPAPAKEEAKAAPKPVEAKLAVGASAGKGKTPTATSTGRRVAVGCAAPGAEGYRCAVTVTRNGKQVGEGRRTGAGIVPVNLDKATARKVQRLGGLKVRVTLTVKTTDGETTTTQKTVRLLPKKVLVVPTDGLFAFDSATPSKGADALAKQIAGQLDGARTITIVGHTDAKGAADVNRRLGQQRAEAFRRLLAKHGFDGKVAVQSAGDTRPRASNATEGGRALNRRVEIDVRY